MRRWADHDSSDDDEDHHHHRNARGGGTPLEENEAGENPNTQEDTQEQRDALQQNPDQNHDDSQPPALRKESYDLPTEAPFTAFVGNLAFSIKDPDRLAQAISDLVFSRFQQEITVINARVMIDKNDGKHRGFGYVEVETLDQLKTVLQLDDGQSSIAGRLIQLDTATKKDNRGGGGGGGNNKSSRLNRATSGGSIPEVDGSKFRAGRFARKNSSENVGAAQTKGQEEAARQRPSLKLQPRSKPREVGMEDSTSSLASASNIFGGARPRDEQAWERRNSHQQTTPATTKETGKEAEAEETKDGPSPQQEQPPQQHQQQPQQGERARRSSTGRAIRVGSDGCHHAGRGDHAGRADHHHHTGRTGDHRQSSGRSFDRGGAGRSGGRTGERGRGPSTRTGSGRVTGASPRPGKKDLPVNKEEKKTAAPVVKQIPANKIVSPPTTQEPEKTDVKKPTNKFALLSLDSDSD